MLDHVTLTWANLSSILWHYEKFEEWEVLSRVEETGLGQSKEKQKMRPESVSAAEEEEDRRLAWESLG